MKASQTKIGLVVPPASLGYGYINQFFWQKGLLSLATHIESNHPSASVTIIDGNTRTLSECAQAISQGMFDILGFHCVDHTRANAIALARVGIQAGVETLLFGGAGAIFGPRQYLAPFLLDSREVFVGACTGPGYGVFDALLSGETDRENFPGLVWQESNGQLRRSVKPKEQEWYKPQSERWHSYEEDIKRYIVAQQTNASFPYVPISCSMMSHIGCIHRSNGASGCGFCGIPHDTYEVCSSSGFWREVQEFERHFSHLGRVQSIKDWGDSVSPQMLKGLIDSRPREFSQVEYSCYLSIREATRTNLALLKQLNCKSVYIGIDGISQEALAQIDKPYDVSFLAQALDELERSGLGLELGIILGRPGETLDSLQESVSVASALMKRFGDRVIVLQGNVTIPMPGSRYFARLEKALTADGMDALAMEVPERIDHFMQKFTHVTFDQCLDAQRAIESISPRRHSYAASSKESPYA